MQGFTGPTLYVGLHRPCSVHRAVQALHFMQGFVDPAVYAGL